ncbi:MAG TPA: hypothetical protein VJT75_18605 [Thermoleophilaceae bacterium]|nr:hypothetical protein [Thermoleophilaceae bacterium]
MSSRAARAALLAFVAGVLVLLVAAVTDKRHLAFSLAVRASQPGLLIQAGQEVCQRSIDVEEPFDEVSLLLATYFEPGPRLEMRVSDDRTGRVLASGVLPDGYPDSRVSVTGLDRTVPAGGRATLCVRNAGTRKVAMFSGPYTDNETSSGAVDGRYVSYDLLVEFVRSKPRSTLSLIPDVFQRASLFHPAWVGPSTFWVLAGLLLLGVPLLLVRALSAAERAEGTDANGGQ